MNPTRREPALLWIGLIAPLVAAVTAFWLVDNPDVQALVNTLSVAVAGAVTAFIVKSDNLLPALTGLAQALIAVIVGFGAHWTPEQQSALMVPIGVIAAIVVRDRVTAPVPAAVVTA